MDQLPQKPSETPLAASLDRGEDTPFDEQLALDAIKAKATRKMTTKLINSVPSERRSELKKLLEGQGVDSVTAILRRLFPDYDERQAAAIEEAKRELHEEAKAKRDQEELQTHEPEASE